MNRALQPLGNNVDNTSTEIIEAE